eukprot:Hpha_TRINITY_DN18659_c0_g1::TRINITY_DN18659_c0_g1_i1::g.115743::m.115743/K11754/folC; dihydrofolate synthase / folylpolyglutamate synthase
MAGTDEDDQEAVRWLSSLPLFGGSGEWNLDSTLRLLQRCGSPHLRLPTVVHVTGTNGKGTTAMLTAELVRAHGKRVLCFTSPHVDDGYRDELRLDGQPLPKTDFTRAVRIVRAALESTTDPPSQPSAFDATLQWLAGKGAVSGVVVGKEGALQCSQFEVLTVVAFLAAATVVEPRPDVFVVEVGLGGRVDCTNAMPPPAVCVFSRVGVDHSRILGSTPRDVAREKAGIVKPGTGAVVCAPQSDQGATEEIRSAVEEAGVGWFCEPKAEWRTDKAVDFLLHAAPGKALERLWSGQVPLPGRHQAENAAVAAQVFNCLRPHVETLGGLNQVSVALALRRFAESDESRGRFEVYDLAESGLYAICDGAHNPDSVKALCRTLEEKAPEMGVETLMCLLGTLADKDYPSTAREFATFALPQARLRAETYAVVPVPCQRGLAPGTFGASLVKAGVASDAVKTDFRDCGAGVKTLAAAMRRAAGAGRKSALLISGSFFLLGPARDALRQVFPSMRRVVV